MWHFVVGLLKFINSASFRGNKHAHIYHSKTISLVLNRSKLK